MGIYASYIDYLRSAAVSMGIYASYIDYLRSAAVNMGIYAIYIDSACVAFSYFMNCAVTR